MPLDPRATYVVVARHPLDMAVSLYHQGGNIDRARLRELTGGPAPGGPPPPRAAEPGCGRGPTADHAAEAMDSLVGVLHHVTDAWRAATPATSSWSTTPTCSRTSPGRCAAADLLGITVPEDRWDALVEAATFASMRGRPTRSPPTPSGC